MNCGKRGIVPILTNFAEYFCANLRDLRETIYEANARVNLRDLRETISALGHFVIHGRLCTLFKAFGPETVLVQDGKHGILHLPLIIEINSSVRSGGIPLPDRPV